MRVSVIDSLIYTVVDLETTGMGASSQITEIAAMTFQGTEEIDRFQTLVNPGQQIPSFISRMTGITNSMVEKAPSIEQAYPRFLDFLRSPVSYAESPTVVAHNAPFDLGFLGRAAQSAEQPLPPVNVIDTLRLGRWSLRRPTVENHRLGTLATYFGIDTTGAHRALRDVYMTAGILWAMVDYVGTDKIDTLNTLFRVAGSRASVTPEERKKVKEIR